MALARFHPVIADWFSRCIGSPTDVQQQAWPVIQSGQDALIAAPTGSGKTFAAFLSCIDALFQQALTRALDDHTYVLYVSPLKALSNDIQKNLHTPLVEIGNGALAAGLLLPELRVTVRTGDTPMVERQQMLRRPPHILITTPESLFILLTAEKSRRLLKTVRTVIVDEIHAVAPNKRGAHLALSLERLEALTAVKPQRIGLSATQRPIETVAELLAGGRPRPVIVDVGHRREMDLGVEVPKDELGAVATNAVWTDIYDRIAELVQAHRSTLVFVNTRRLAERVSHYLEARLQHLGEDVVAAHHGSLSKQIRLSAEDRLKTGKARVVVATASLELGIDVGTVDLVCQIGSPRAISTCLQRIGRAGHWIRAIPKGRLFSTTRDELIECAALIRSVRAGVLDRIEIPSCPLDVLSQQVVAAAATQAWNVDDLYALCRRAYPYRILDRSTFEEVLEMLAGGIATNRGRGRSHIHYDRINQRLRGRRGARLAAITSGGAIPETANYAVIAEPEGTVVGSVDEDFAVESLAGDIILLGNTSWKIRGVETGKMRVENAHGAPPSIPFWRGEAPARTAELSAEVALVRREIAQQSALPDPYAAVRWLKAHCGLDQRGAEQAATYVAAGLAVLGTVPTQQTIVAERFFDESGGMQLILHTPFGGRVNRAWGLALRKRFCVTFDFELQAAATDNGIVISLGERHSFPLESVFQFLRHETVREVLTQAVLQAPMFMTRWRWNATRALALLRFVGGKKVPPQIQRMRAEDLLGAVFPDAIACQDNVHGDRTGRQIPDHPLVRETLRDCLTEAMDLDGLIQVLCRIEDNTITCVAIDTPVPSPFCHEILNANPYAFLDDAPLEERRARAVEMRRSLPPELAGKMGALDPGAIEEVAEESWPVVRDPDELHDALLTLVWVPVEEASAWNIHAEHLLATNRLGHVYAKDAMIGWTATDHTALMRVLFPDAVITPEGSLSQNTTLAGRDEVVDKIVIGWMESIGPTTAPELATRLHLAIQDIESSLLRVEGQGLVLRGRFRPTQHPALNTQHSGAAPVEWCHRRLLARIHRLTIGKLRKEIEPVSAAEFMRFLFQWQHVAPGSRLHGKDGLLEVIRQLSGFEAAASAWEPHLLRSRLSKYDPVLLDQACLSGAVAWGRLSPHPRSLQDPSASRGRRVVPTSVAPISIFLREEGGWLLTASGDESSQDDPTRWLSTTAQTVYRYLRERGASFFADLVRSTALLPAEIEDGLWELVAAGLVTADGFDNLRALIDPRRRRAEGRERVRRPRYVSGRWTLLRPAMSSNVTRDERVDSVVRQLLRRYGLVFRDLLGRESVSLPWRDLLVHLRRLEMRGEVRGGRFVSGFIGDQFALPEAVESLRAMRRSDRTSGQGIDIKLSAADPLNLAGVILPGPRIPATQTNYVVFRDGIPVRSEAPRELVPLASGRDESLECRVLP